jgi:hypothetical protein
MPSLISEIAALRRMMVKQLRQKYADVFGEATNAGHKDWLVKRVAWRLQAKAEGGLSERAYRRAEELANEADLRLSRPQPGLHDQLSPGRGGGLGVGRGFLPHRSFRHTACIERGETGLTA